MDSAAARMQIVGGILVGIAFVKFSLIGLYPYEFVRYALIGAIGSGLLIASQKMKDRELDPEPEHRSSPEFPPR